MASTCCSAMRSSQRIAALAPHCPAASAWGCVPEVTTSLRTFCTSGLWRCSVQAWCSGDESAGESVRVSTAQAGLPTVSGHPPDPHTQAQTHCGGGNSFWALPLAQTAPREWPPLRYAALHRPQQASHGAAAWGSGPPTPRVLHSAAWHGAVAGVRREAEGLGHHGMRGPLAAAARNQGSSSTSSGQTGAHPHQTYKCHPNGAITSPLARADGESGCRRPWPEAVR